MRKMIQFIIVLLILLTCGGMFTIFLGKVREEAARPQCTNNFKQLGLAIGNYHDTYAAFPQADLPNMALLPEKRLSWLVILIPYVEANNIYSRMDKEKSWDAEENRFATEMRLAYLRCPGCPDHPRDNSLAPTHYVGISGIDDNAVTLPRDDPRAGLFGYDRPVKKDELKRGASEAVVAVETSQVIGAWTAAGRPTTRGLIPDGPAYFGVKGQFGGNHPHGANVVFVDGSVRFIEQSIDPAAWEAMATLSGKGNQE
jgi:prepilin-type processing-associated H-X9-DG protein